MSQSSSLGSYPQFALKYWVLEALSKLASQLGIPRFADIVTSIRDRNQFARVQVKVEIRDTLKEKVWYINA